MAEPVKVSVKKKKVKVSGSPSIPPKPGQVSRGGSRASVNRGSNTSSGAAAAAFAAQQQKQQQALLRQQQLQQQQLRAQQYANMTPQQRAMYQQQLRQQQIQQQQMQLQQQQQQLKQQMQQQGNTQMTQQQAAQLRAQQYANMTPQQRAMYQQQLRQQQIQQQQMQLKQQQLRQQQMQGSPQTNKRATQALGTPPLPSPPKEMKTPALPTPPGGIPPPAAPTPQPKMPVIPIKPPVPVKETKDTPPTTKPPTVPGRDKPPKSKPPTIPGKENPPKNKPPSVPSKLTGKEVELHWPTDKTPFEQPDEKERIVYEQKEDDFSKAKIKAATIEKLIEKATTYNADASLQKTFMLTYRSMITPEELLDLLILRFTMPLPKGNEASVEAFKQKQQRPIQVRVCQLLKTWITKYYTDFENKTELQQKLLDFCSNIIKPVCPPGATLESIIQRQMAGTYEKEKPIQFTEPPPEPILPKIARPSFLDIHPMEIARQLTIIESTLYRAIRPEECLGLAWSKKDAKDRAPNILKMINRFNVVSNWVVSEILRQDTQKQRVDTLGQFIEIAERCRGLNNFNACMEIISGLGDSSVHRLKSHWNELPKKTLNMYNELKVILSSEQSYKNFRAYIKTCHGACIPYLGMYLTDLTFIEDGNKDKLSGLHNFSKRIFVSNVIQEIQQYQQSPYILKPVPAIQNFFNALEDKVIDKEECYQISLKILPRGGGKKTSSAPTPKKQEGDDYGEMQQVPGYPFNEKDTAQNIKLQKNPNDGASKVIGGTLAKVVERITYKTFPETQLVYAFLLTYRNYTTGKALMDLLIMRFNMPLPTNPQQMERFKKEQLLPVQLRVLNVLKNWVDHFWMDFVLEKPLATTFFNFVNGNTSMHSASLKRIAKTLKQKTAKNSKERRGTLVSSTVPPSVMPLQPGADKNNLTFLDFHPIEVARQICLFDFQTYAAIQPLEFINRLVDSDAKRARNIIQLRRRVSAFKNWVVHQVIQIEASKRRKMLVQIIESTYELYELKDFNAVVGLLQGLQSPEVTSLSQTWDSVDQSTMDKLKNIKSIGSNLTSLRVFREHVIQDCLDDPAIYPIEGYIQEIELIEQNESSTIENGMLNMAKNRKLSSSVGEFLYSQNNAYNFELQAWLQNYIRSEILSFADRDGFSDQIPLSEQIASMDATQVKTAIKSRMVEDPQVRSELLKALKKGLLSEVASEELEAFTAQVESFKQRMRQQLETVHEKFGRGSFPEYDAEESLNKRFGSDLDTLEDWKLEDQEGIVYGWPEQVSIPTLSTPDGETYLVYQRKVFDKAELSLLLRIQAFYEQYSGCETSTKLVAISHYVAPNTRPFANQHNVEVICI